MTGLRPAEAQTVRDTVRDVGAALQMIARSDAYEADRGASVVRGTDRLDAAIAAVRDGAATPKAGFKALDAVYEGLAAFAPPRRRAMLRNMRDNVRAVTQGSPNAQRLRDEFYLAFYGTLLTTKRRPEQVERQLVKLFGPRPAERLIARYELAVSRSR